MCRDIVVITTAHIHPTNPKIRFCAGSIPAHSVSEICDESLELRLNKSIE